MMEVLVCIGSSCHLKGSYEIIQAFKQCVKERGLEDRVDLSASFCLGHCTHGVTIKVGGEIVTGVSAENAGEVFEREVVGRLEA